MNQKKKKYIQKAKPQKVQVKKIPNTTKLGNQQLFLLFCLLVLVFIAYFPALHKEFTNYDDDYYITQNPYVINFQFSHIPAIFSHFYRAQYSPIPSVIYGFIHLLVGFKPYLYNLVGVVLHLFTILLVFKLIWSLCNNFRIAFVTAALFGIATMQVESIAWLAAVYKTCTYSIFFLSSLIVYISYIKTKKNKYLIISVLLFIISCLCKEQAVALTLAVVAIDIFYQRKLLSKKVIIEKIPFLLISLIFGLIEIAATKSFHEEGINVTSFSNIDRVIYISYALCAYIYKLFAPVNLSLYYCYFPLENLRLFYMILPLLILILIWLFIRAVKKKNKYVIFGGLFFVLNILFSLTSQIVEVRPNIMADRYDYLASIGIFFIVAKWGDILIEKKQVKLQLITVFFIAFFFVTAYFTSSRIKVWNNSMNVWNDVISKSPTEYVAYYNRGNLKSDKNDFKGAIDDYNKAISIYPTLYQAYYNRGNMKLNIGDNIGAIEDYNKTIEISPTHYLAYLNRGNLKEAKGDYQGAIYDYNKVIEISPNYPGAYSNRAIAWYYQKDFNNALKDCEKALNLNPGDKTALKIKTKSQQILQKTGK